MEFAARGEKGGALIFTDEPERSIAIELIDGGLVIGSYSQGFPTIEGVREKGMLELCEENAPKKVAAAVKPAAKWLTKTLWSIAGAVGVIVLGVVAQRPDFQGWVNSLIDKLVK